MGLALALVDELILWPELDLTEGLALGLEVVHTGLQLTGQLSIYAESESKQLEIASIYEHFSNSKQEVSLPLKSN